MQLRSARLCLDCEEIHDAPACPTCGSAFFAYISRWIPAPERRHRAQPTDPEPVETYRRLLAPQEESKAGRWIKRGAVVGLAAAMGVSGWAWRRRNVARRGTAAEREHSATGDAPRRGADTITPDGTPH